VLDVGPGRDGRDRGRDGPDDDPTTVPPVFRFRLARACQGHDGCVSDFMATALVGEQALTRAGSLERVTGIEPA
jgi:hypothetical protein